VAHQERRTEALRRLTAEIASADDIASVAGRALEHGLEVARATWGRIVIRQHEGVPRTVVEQGDAVAGVSVERLRSGGDDLGSLALSPPADELDAEGRRMREMFVGLTAAAVARTRQRQSDHELADTLQSMLLPRLPPNLDGASLCGVYLPRAAAVGGDWYDAFVTDVGYKFVVGDIVGKGARAAGAMGNLRIATHVVRDHRRPESVLDAFDAVAAELDDVFLATAAVVVADREARVIRSSLAGHPPPLLVSPSGDVVWLDGGKGLPLGVDHPGSRDHAVTRWVGPVRLVLYSDGLVERRDEALSDGLDRLADSVMRHRALELAEFCDAVTADLLLPGARRTDDVAVLAVDLLGP
jgi:serine phosphatase RsbU (regulator of sigma subunit)